MSSPGDMSIRPIPSAELPAVRRVTDRKDRQKQEPHSHTESEKPRALDETSEDPDDGSPPKPRDGAGGTIDVMA